MNLFTAGLIIVGVASVAIGAMLLVRRTAPEGSYFQDGDRAAGVFGVLSTGFAILLGFVVFLAFSSYDISRSGAEDEAQIVSQQFQTAQLLPEAARKPPAGRGRSSPRRSTSSTAWSMSGIRARTASVGASAQAWPGLAHSRMVDRRPASRPIFPR